MKLRQKSLSILLIIAMVFSLLPPITITAADVTQTLAVGGTYSSNLDAIFDNPYWSGADNIMASVTASSGGNVAYATKQITDVYTGQLFVWNGENTLGDGSSTFTFSASQAGVYTITLTALLEEDPGGDRTRTLVLTFQSVNETPVASGVTATGTAVVGQTLTGSYSYSDTESNPEGTSTFKWYRATDENGAGKTAISGQTAKTYTLTSGDLGKYIAFEVTPVASAGSSPGTTKTSDFVGPVKTTQDPINYNDVTKTYGNADFNYTATGGSSSNAFTYASSDTTIATINSSTGLVSILKAGTVTLTATKPGDATYADASKSCTLTINPKDISATATANSKVYDGTTAATGTISLTDVLAGDVGQVSATGTFAFTDSSIGDNKTVNVTGISLTGAKAGSYHLTNTSTTATANINSKIALDVTVPAGWTKNDKTATITTTLDSGATVKTLTVNGIDITGQSTYTISANGAYNFVLTDSNDRTASKSVNVSDIDKSLPVINSVSQSPDSSTWTNGNVVITVNASDSGSGIDQYCFDGTTWQDASSITIAANHTYNIGDIKVRDEVGNITTYNAVFAVSNIDTTLPAIDSVGGNPNDWTKNDVTLTVNASDTESGVFRYSFDGGSTWQDSNQKTYSANTTLAINTVQVKDNAGNVKTYATQIVIDKIDKAAPSFNSLTPSTVAWTAGDVILTLNVTDNQSGIKDYSFDGGSHWQADPFITLTQNHDFSADTILARDNVGNVYTYGSDFHVQNIDKTAPYDPAITNITMYSSDHWYNSQQTIAATFTTTPGCAEKLQYSIDGGGWTDGTSALVSDAGIHNVKFRTIDALNRTSSESTAIVQIDKAAPTILTAQATKINDSDFCRILNQITFGMFFKEGFKVTVTASDDYSGLKNLIYNYDGVDKTVSFSAGSAAFTITDKVLGTLKLKAVDNVDNQSTDWTQLSDLVNEADLPTITVNTDLTEWKNANFDVSVTTADADSGINTVTVSVDGGAPVTVFSAVAGTALTTSKEVTGTITLEGSHTYTITVEDNSGNIATKDFIAKLDKTTPTLSSVSSTPNGWTNGNVTVSVQASDSVSGIKEYSFDGGTSWQASNSKAYSANETVASGSIRVKDNAGNVTQYGSAVVIDKIEKGSPTITDVTGNPTAVTDQDVTLTVHATDTDSGIKEYSFDGGTAWQASNTKTYSDNITIAAGTIKVRDNAGNIAAYNTPIAITMINKVPPALYDVTSVNLVNPTTISVKSTKAGVIYLVVKAAANYTSKAQLEAVATKQSKSCAADTTVIFQIGGYAAGYYQLYATDVSKVSAPVDFQVSYPLTASDSGAVSRTSSAASSAASSQTSSSASSVNPVSSSAPQTSSVSSSTSSAVIEPTVTKTDNGKTVTFIQEDKETKVNVSGLNESVKVPETANPDVSKVTVELIVDPVKEEKKPNFIITAESTLDKANQDILSAFDVSLIKKIYTGSDVDTQKVKNSDITGWITVRLPMPAGFENRKDLQVVYINDQGAVTRFDTSVVTIDGVKYLEFKTNHFSTYAIVAKTEKALNSPDTGHQNFMTIFIAMFVLCAGAALFFAVQSGKNKKRK